ncbi:hypothetical protein CC80DRAFT_581401 [Byssothecium circinans]|uniref:Uncharacterized protein n=1 Tax=Byssothecium circinans TaxID=147558 RepID=A0A6A5T9P4_9PLEO|nr:hypothetical protein CC80DRAFT_581401 [Byssothecium circinans]
MAGAVFSVIGLVGGILDLAPMFGSMIPPKSGSETTVRIGVGTSINKQDSTGGDTPGIRLFDVMGRDIGQASGSSKAKILDGGYKDITVKAAKGMEGRQAQYISVSQGGNDALCISYISMTWSDGQNKAWYGDVGKECGGVWYNSQTLMGDGDYRPRCVWIDGDGTNGIKTKGMGIHITDFTATEKRAQAYVKDPDTMCKSKPRFRLYEDLKLEHSLPYFSPPLEYDSDLVDKDRTKVLVDGASTGKLPPKNKKRSPREHRALLSKRYNFPGTLISSKQDGHSAKELCESDTSLGPDFVSFHEGLFCDMSEKQLWPLCGSGVESGCFNTTDHTMISKSKSRRDESTGRLIPEKEYVDLQSW